VYAAIASRPLNESVSVCGGNGGPQGDVTCTNIPAGDTVFCGRFTPGSYQASVDTAQCGANSRQVTFAAGDVTRVVRCE